MELLRELFEFFLHIDEALKQLTATYGVWTYAILVLVVFCETGLVVTPFLPGDSLLFAAGAIAADPAAGLDPLVLYVLLTVAAIVGDSVNYSIGARLGIKIFDLNLPFVKREYLDRANEFYAKHGAKMIVMARFVPIVRTFAPFAAGIAKMDYKTFITYNVVGALIWTTLFIWAGYFFGNLPFVQDNFELVALAIVVLSVVPMIYEWIQSRRKHA
ncbi:MAG: DedA family protein [Chloroflexi bacterium]|nr:MAG: DedA family protein [Chloroflexota bacterium]